MFYQSVLLAVAVLAQLSAAGTSFLAINSQRYQEALNDDKIESWAQLSDLGNANEPLVCFRFAQFDLLAQIARSSAETRFLPTFFEDSVTDVWNDDSLSATSEITKSAIVEVGQLSELVIPSLYSKIDDNDAVVLFEFTEPSYDLERLDEYLETVYLFLEEALPNIDNLVIQVPSVGETYTKSSAKTSEVEVSDPEKNPGKDLPAGDGRKVNALWTEGLISCLIVAALLLSILVTAISWITSLEISYGALERPANPLKKNN
ncbi:LANO_0F09868g1_1 [Lachancea nothofagi CBS 11611]|uniref:LANO_0F09868g1_1 n=1 Tax=Lachancea nothofagi CBS 11611 TaxID=1266666 RepID=A0A1G4KA30_9SACH|nr:LANO_0F09868g1_1 [Lachancea nothofagi CBS 11611]